MLKKRYIKTRQTCKVTFELPAAEIPAELEPESVHLVGEFNDWDETATPMQKNRQNVYRAVLDLEPGRPYQFRYLINGEHWINDWQADQYITNAYGEDNSVVVTCTADNPA